MVTYIKSKGRIVSLPKGSKIVLISNPRLLSLGIINEPLTRLDGSIIEFGFDDFESIQKVCKEKNVELVDWE